MFAILGQTAHPPAHFSEFRAFPAFFVLASHILLREFQHILSFGLQKSQQRRVGSGCFHPVAGGYSRGENCFFSNEIPKYFLGTSFHTIKSLLLPAAPLKQILPHDPACSSTIPRLHHIYCSPPLPRECLPPPQVPFGPQCLSPVATAMRWDRAQEHCAALVPGGRLAMVPSMEPRPECEGGSTPVGQLVLGSENAPIAGDAFFDL